MHKLTATNTPTAHNSVLILKRLIVLRALLVSSLGLYVIGFSGDTDTVLPVALLMLLSTLFSTLVWQRYRGGKHQPANAMLLSQLIWDALIVLIFVYINGRSTNPFIYYLLVITAISASIFRERTVWLFSASSIMAYSLFMYLDTNEHMAHMTAEFRSHLFGMWINFVSSSVLISFFITRLTATLKNRERALALAREEILKNEQIIGIGTLAASTVHSFGTPLSTIAMATDEIEALHADSETADAVKTIRQQIQRCKNTMAKLTSLASHKSNPQQSMLLETFFADIKEHFTLVNAAPMPSFNLVNANLKAPVPGGILLLHAIINLVDNGIQAANSCVNIVVKSSKNTLQILIEDDGSGLRPEALENVGDVIFNSKTGLGIGVLLANSTIESLGGSVHFANPIAEEETPLTRVSVEIPLVNGEANNG